MKKIPEILEYFYYDILEENKSFSIKKMFGCYWIFKENKIFALYNDDEFYFRKSIFVENNPQMYYFKKWQKIFLPYFKVSWSILEDKEKLFEYIEESLKY